VPATSKKLLIKYATSISIFYEIIISPYNQAVNGVFFEFFVTSAHSYGLFQVLG